MKITFLQIDEAFRRTVYGESVRAIARSMGVTEGCLRFHFRKGASLKEVRRISYAFFHAKWLYSKLAAEEQKVVDRLVAKRS